MESFAVRLKRVRENNLWHKKTIADKLEVPYQTWVGWESGTATPPVYTQNLLLEKIDRMSKGEM